MDNIKFMQIDDRVYNAIRDDRLVVFAGAGVSMGAPSCLPSFEELTKQIARRTFRYEEFFCKKSPDPLDQVLGKLRHSEVNVHALTKEALSPEGSKPNNLHKDLLRLFRTSKRVRLVTTNFDLHFEDAAREVFGEIPDVFDAPALPLGHDFTGIVHLHGSLRNYKNMVLTDSDFGRAYLTEGWARRFLLGLFRNYTVLFVGYSHKDLIMTYLARALPIESDYSRYAIAPEFPDSGWELLGIRHIPFEVGPDGSFQQLYDGISWLANVATRGALDWRARLRELCSEGPPTDVLSVTEVEHALSDAEKTKFFTDFARHPAWLEWLNERGYLDNLFEGDALSSRDRHLAWWVADQFVVDHSEAVFGLFTGRAMRLNPKFWSVLGRALGADKAVEMEQVIRRRWMTIMLSTVPFVVDVHRLLWLAEICFKAGELQFVLDVFLLLCDRRLHLKSERSGLAHRDDIRTPTVSSTFVGNHFALNKIWNEYLKSGLTVEFVEKLIAGVEALLERQYRYAATWDSHFTDRESRRRAAIEPHEQDRYRQSIDVVIDAVRDALEYLGDRQPKQVMYWVNKLLMSDAIVLRRVAIHIAGSYSPMDSDERLHWLLEYTDFLGLEVRHEVYRAVAENYSDAGAETRKSILDVIQAYKLRLHKDSDLKPTEIEREETRFRFDWYHWLLKADPNCELARSALTPIERAYPEWIPKTHPDLLGWVGEVEVIMDQSPWTVEELLAMDSAECLDDLLNFKQTDIGGPTRYGLLQNIKEACKRNVAWGLKLGRELLAREHYSADVWDYALSGLRESDSKIKRRFEIVELLSNLELFIAHPLESARLLKSMMDSNNKIDLADLVPRSNEVALKMWQSLKSHAGAADDLKDMGWVTRAINHPVGVIVQYWLRSLSVLQRGSPLRQSGLPRDYQKWFCDAIDEPGMIGGMARAILTSQIRYLYYLDDGWTKEHVLPMLEHGNSDIFSQAWDGFLAWGSLTAELAPLMEGLFHDAFARIELICADLRDRFLGFFTSLAVFYVSGDRIGKFLKVLFQHGSIADRDVFARHIQMLLADMEPDAIGELWERWLRHYWGERLLGLQEELEESERQIMLKWLPYLGDAFPEGVRLAKKFPAGELTSYDLLYLLKNGDLPQRFPEDVARLLIYLSTWNLRYWTSDLPSVANQLLELPDDLREELNEALVTLGLDEIGT